MLKFDIEGLPDSLPKGTYATSVKRALWTTEGDMLIVLEYAHGRLPAESLFKIEVDGGSDDG